MKDYSKLFEIAKQNNGVIQTKDVVANNIAKDYLKYAIQDGVLEKIRNGLYITPNTIADEAYFIQLKSKHLVYSYDTSAYFNKLTTRDPLYYSITTTRDNNVSTIKSNTYKLDFHFVSKELFELGIITTKTIFGNDIKIYDKERTICDLLSKKFDGDRFIATESLKTYLALKDRDLNKLMTYAKKLKVDERLKDMLEVLT